MARPVYYRVHHARIRSFMAPGQPVDRLLNSVLTSTETYAKQFVGVRSRRLRNNIGVRRRARMSGDLQMNGAVGANLRYAGWVERGTKGHRKPSGSGMRVPRRRGVRRGAELANRHVFYARSVRGQKAQRYMERGLNMAVQREGRLSVRISQPRVG